MRLRGSDAVRIAAMNVVLVTAARESAYFSVVVLQFNKEVRLAIHA
jgi:hypothetical protein